MKPKRKTSNAARKRGPHGKKDTGAAATPYPYPVRLSLSSPESARRSFGRLMKERLKGRVDFATFGQMSYAFQIFIGAIRQEKWGDIEKRMDKIEAQQCEKKL